MRIVVCEDDLSTREANQLVIKTAANQAKVGIELIAFENAEQLLFALPDMASVDLLVLDIQMSGINGMDLAKKSEKMTNRWPFYSSVITMIMSLMVMKSMPWDIS